MVRITKRPERGWLHISNEKTNTKSQGNIWSRRSRVGKIGIVVGSVLVLIIVIAALAGSPEEEETAPPAATTTQEEPEADDEAEAQEEAEPEPTPEPEPEPVAVPEPQPSQLNGSGQRVVETNLRAETPLIVTGSHQGSSNFIVTLVSADSGAEEFLFNEIGSYRGQAVVAEPSPGRHRVQVNADGPWSLQFRQVYPGDLQATRLPGAIEDGGARVVRVETTEDLQPVVAGRHRGQSNFIVTLIGYGDVTGTEFLFNEIGNFEGETLTQMPAGNYLLWVQADGPWWLEFRP